MIPLDPCRFGDPVRFAGDRGGAATGRPSMPR